ncbi:MAG: TlpA family protein disulfide reductase [Zoogloeaceae bacterium]|nr:TlpA family protein disulfide reductase [Zoogloeaceae bacterium]
MSLHPCGRLAAGPVGVRLGFARVCCGLAVTAVALVWANGVRAAPFAALKPVSPQVPPALMAEPAQSNLLDSLRGRPVIVNFWATWCEPCRDEMPALDRLRGRRADVVVITVAMNDSAAKVARFVDDYLLDLRIVHDPDGVQGRAWGVRVLPTSVFIDASGHIRYRAVGALDWDESSMDRVLDRLKSAP